MTTLYLDTLRTFECFPNELIYNHKENNRSFVFIKQNERCNKWIISAQNQSLLRLLRKLNQLLGKVQQKRKGYHLREVVDSKPTKPTKPLLN
jgi:hypothetical protein